MIGLVDIGNTRLKWALLGEAGLDAIAGAGHRDDPAAAVAAFAAALPANVERVLAANVAGAALGAALAAAVRARAGIDVEVIEPEAERYGVRCAYADPSRLGADRWLAMIAAHASVRSLVCVIQAGTAVTLDAVDGDGRHVGGLILPGPHLMAEALARNTSRIGERVAALDRPSGAHVLGASTEEAVARGAMLALAAGIDRAVRDTSAADGHEATVLLTGGDAERLLPWLETKAHFRADLVLAGLAFVARHGE